MVKQAGVVAWLGGIAALNGLATWSGLGAVGQAVSSVGWGILLVVLARAVALAVAGGGMVAAVSFEDASAASHLRSAAVRSRGDQRPIAAGASRRRSHRRGLADVVRRSGRARGGERHRRRAHPGRNTVSVRDPRSSDACCTGSGSGPGTKRRGRDCGRDAHACGLLSGATPWRATYSSRNRESSDR